MREFNCDGIIVGRPYQTVHEQSLTQKFPIGTIYEAFGKRWRYCRAVANITPARRGCPTLIYNPWLDSVTVSGPQFGADATTATGVLGNNELILSFAAACDVARAVDILQDGIITLFDAGGILIYQYRIIGNDASYQATLPDDRIKVYVDPPLVANMTAVPCDGMPSPYMFCADGESVGAQASVVCVPEIPVDSGSFFWGQTRGPAWVTPSPGWNTAATREAEWHTNGCIKAAAGVALQRAGYLLAQNANADDAHIMLMLE
jgi:hypothetical protein